MSKRAGWAVTGVLSIGLAMAVWLFLGGGGSGANAWFGDDRDGGFVAEDAIELECDEEAPAGPALEGRTAVTSSGPVRYGTVDVLVVGPTGAPLPEVLLEATPPTPGEGEPKINALRATTLEDGTTQFSNLPFDGSWTIRPVREGGRGRVSLSNVRFASRTGDVFTLTPQQTPSVAVTDPQARLVLDRGFPLHVDVIAADTGFLFETGPWAAEPDLANARDVSLRHAPIQPVAVEPGNDAKIRTFLSEFADQVFADNEGFQTWISPRATRLEAEVPLRSEALLIVGLPDGVELGSDGDWQVTYVVGGRFKGQATATPDAFGRIRVLGVPFLPGEPVLLKGALRKKGQLAASGTFGLDGRDDLFLEARYTPYDKRMQTIVKLMKHANKTQAIAQQLQIELRTTVQGVVVASDAVEAAAIWTLRAGEKGMHGVDWDVFEGPLRDEPAPDETKGTIRLALSTPQGKPAAGAVATVGSLRQVANTKGIAYFGDLPPGEYEVRVVGAGASFVRTARVVAKETTKLEFTAPEGGKIDLEVVDDNGDALPFATVTLKQESTLPYADVELGVQRVDGFVDHRGRRLFRGVEPGTVTLDVVYGSRRASVEVIVMDGSVVAARAVLVRKRAPTPEELMAEAEKAKAATASASEDGVREQLMQERAKLMEAFEALKAARDAAERAKGK